MSTSGTVAKTTITTATLIEHAFRRCGINPSAQTPESLETAKNSLFLMLLLWAGRGLNLWCLDTHFIALQEGKREYPLPAGTIGLLKAYLKSPSGLNPEVETLSLNVANLEFLEPWKPQCARLEVSAETGIVVEGSSDGVTWTNIFTGRVLNPLSWIELDYSGSYTRFRITADTGVTISDVFLGLPGASIPLSTYNFHQYLEVEYIQSSGVTSYFFDKQLNPTIKLWGSPTTSYSYVAAFTHRQIQDIGRLTNSVEVPTHWMEAVIWNLALRLVHEVPNADMSRMATIQAMSISTLAEAESTENDGSGLTFNFDLSSYTRW